MNLKIRFNFFVQVEIIDPLVLNSGNMNGNGSSRDRDRLDSRALSDPDESSQFQVAQWPNLFHSPLISLSLSYKPVYLSIYFFILKDIFFTPFSG